MRRLETIRTFGLSDRTFRSTMFFVMEQSHDCATYAATLAELAEFRHLGLPLDTISLTSESQNH